MQLFFVVSDFVVPPLRGVYDPDTSKMLTSFAIDTGGQNWVVWESDDGARLHASFINERFGALVVETSCYGDAEHFVSAVVSILSYWMRSPITDIRRPPAVQLVSLPDPSWTRSELNKAIHSPDGNVMGLEWGSGSVLMGRDLVALRETLPIVMGDKYLATALRHLAYSECLWTYSMGSSYYAVHYHLERVEMSEDDLHREYMMFRPLLELSFVSAFRALEAALGCQHVKSGNYIKALNEAGLEVKPDSSWNLLHLKFARNAEHESFADLLKLFVDVRNTVAAHAAVFPPPHLLLSRDLLLEAQSFVRYLCQARLGRITGDMTLPRMAFAEITDVVR